MDDLARSVEGRALGLRRFRGKAYAGVCFPADKVLTDGDRVIGVRRFGASGPAAAVAEHFGFTAEQVAARLSQSL